MVGHPGDGKTIGYTMLYMMASTTKNKEWAWKLLQYLGGRTKDGQYTQANRLATDAMLGSGYQSVMDCDLLKKGWAKWGDVPTILGIWKQGVQLLRRRARRLPEVVPALERRHERRADRVPVGARSPPDQACDNMVAAVAKAKSA